MYYDIKQSGRRIKEARLRKGYTQAQLSFLIGMEENSMARIELINQKIHCKVDGTKRKSEVSLVESPLFVSCDTGYFE